MIAVEIVVAGATGVLGRRVAGELARRGHAVRALSRHAAEHPVAGIEHSVADVTTGAGLRDALAGAHAVVDATNRRDRRAATVLVEGTRRLVAAAAREDVGHVVGISIVGIEAVPLAYYRVKLEQERAIQQGDVRWSIVRATQFHDLLDWIFAGTARFGFVVSGRFRVAPVDPAVVAHVLADAVEGGPGGRVAEVSGPRAEPLADLARAWLTATDRHAVRVGPPMRRALRDALAAGGLVPADGAIGDGPGFAEWLGLRSGDARAGSRPSQVAR